MCKAERLLSYSLLSLISGRLLASAPMTGISDDEVEDDEEGTRPNLKRRGMVNSEGAWCWREGCSGELNPWSTTCCSDVERKARLSQTDQGDAKDLGDAPEHCGSVR